MTEALGAIDAGGEAASRDQGEVATIASSASSRAVLPQAGTGPASGSVLVLLQGEAVVEMLLAVAGYRHLGGTWLMFALLFAVPDVSMAGFLVSPRCGARLYNLGHTYVAPALLAAMGVLVAVPILPLLALIWTAHIGVDRAIGAGLKYGTGFGFTHLRSKTRKQRRDA